MRLTDYFGSLNTFVFLYRDENGAGTLQMASSADWKIYSWDELELNSVSNNFQTLFDTYWVYFMRINSSTI